MVEIGIHVIINGGIHMILLLTRCAKLGLMWVSEIVRVGIHTVVLLTGFSIFVVRTIVYVWDCLLWLRC